MHEDLEFYSVIRAIKAMDEADVCLLMLDASKGITAQDLNIFSLAVKKGKGIVVLVNKWDLVEKETNTAKEYEKELKNGSRPLPMCRSSLFPSSKKPASLKPSRLRWKFMRTGKRKCLLQTERSDVEGWKPIMRRWSRGIAEDKIYHAVAYGVPSFAFFLQFPG